ncbi:hypothetical protein [Sphingobacterium faecium]|uniref:hypothetical protein n=1 Tax=Sphingobacterium faecium TaxID=34087 RepID=UPI00246954E9|nr:hypothetical protein [Sphingobacterium faecium]MDH5825790.1 hypothetical protein [Sphingobacterium faecium]
MKILRKLWIKFLIRQLKKGALNSESATRILIHYTLLQMKEKGKEELTIEYEAPDITGTRLIILAYLTEKT